MLPKELMIMFAGQIVFEAVWSLLQGMSMLYILRYFNPLYHGTKDRSYFTLRIFIAYVCLCIVSVLPAVSTFVAQSFDRFLWLSVGILTIIQSVLIKRPSNVSKYSFYATLIGLNSIGTVLLVPFSFFWFLLNIQYLSV